MVCPCLKKKAENLEVFERSFEEEHEHNSDCESNCEDAIDLLDIDLKDEKEKQRESNETPCMKMCRVWLRAIDDALLLSLPNASLQVPLNYRGRTKYTNRKTCVFAVLVLFVLIVYCKHVLSSIGIIQNTLKLFEPFRSNNELAKSY